MWPFKRREVRSAYTDALTLALIRDAEGADVPRSQAVAVAVAEACALLYSRALGSATVTGSDALTPSVLGCIGRELVRCGESVHILEVGRDGLRLVPVSHWDVRGRSHDPERWMYELQIDGPDSTVTVRRPGANVLHCRWSTPAARPWKGEGPLQVAGLSAEMLSSLETRLGQEASAPVANVIPSPADGGSTTTASLRQDLKGAKGGVVMAETMAGGYGDRGGAPLSDWDVKRIGGNPPDVLRALRSDVGRDVAGACGVPPDLLVSGSDSAGQREAYRRWLWSAVVPLGKLVAEEATAKLGAAVSLGFEGLGAGDLTGRTRSLKQLVEAGVPLADARRLAGLD